MKDAYVQTQSRKNRKLALEVCFCRRESEELYQRSQKTQVTHQLLAEAHKQGRKHFRLSGQHPNPPSTNQSYENLVNNLKKIPVLFQGSPKLE